MRQKLPPSLLVNRSALPWRRGLGASLQGHREYLQERLEQIGFRVLPGQVGCPVAAACSMDEGAKVVSPVAAIEFACCPAAHWLKWLGSATVHDALHVPALMSMLHTTTRDL